MATQFMVIDTAIAWGEGEDYDTPIRVTVEDDLVVITPHDHDEPVRIAIVPEDWEELDRFVRAQLPKPAKSD